MSNVFVRQKNLLRDMESQSPRHLYTMLEAVACAPKSSDSAKAWAQQVLRDSAFYPLQKKLAQACKNPNALSPIRLARLKYAAILAVGLQQVQAV